MKTTLSIALFVSLLSGSAIAAETLEEVESEVFQTTGSPQEITKKAKSCIAKLVRNDEVRISGSSQAGFFGGLANPGAAGSASGGVSGGDVLVSVDIENGEIIANSRHKYTRNILKMNVQSTITFNARENRFKIKHTNIKYLQQSTGTMHNDGYNQIYKSWGTGWKRADEELQKVSKKIAECVIATEAEEDW